MKVLLSLDKIIACAEEYPKTRRSDLISSREQL